MAKRVQVVLNEDVLSLGRDGDLVEVAPGYARNFGRFTVKKQTGEDDVLFGTVTNGDVAEVIEEATKKEVDRRDITVPDIHRTGNYKVQVKLHSEVTAEINLEVVSY